MNPVKPTNSKWAEIKEHGVLGGQIEPLFNLKNSKWFALLGLAILGIISIGTLPIQGRIAILPNYNSNGLAFTRRK